MPRRSVDAQEASDLARRIGQGLRERREGLRWTQAGAAERLGMTPEAYARIERGSSLPSFPTFVRACDCLGATPDVLLAGTMAHRRPGIRDVRAYPTEDLESLFREIQDLDQDAVRILKLLVHLLWRRERRLGEFP